MSAGFLNRARHLAAAAAGHPLVPEQMYVVWFCKTLGNWKALVSTDVIDGHYWEITHNGAKRETYVDAYVKTLNVAIPDPDPDPVADVVEDAADVWDGSIPPGGYVCFVCKTPTESEPCQEHQPIAYGRIL